MPWTTIVIILSVLFGCVAYAISRLRHTSRELDEWIDNHSPNTP